MARIVAAAVATTQNKTAIVGARRLFVDASETIRRMHLVSYAIQSVHKVAGATQLYHNRSPVLSSLEFELLRFARRRGRVQALEQHLRRCKLQHKNAKSINSRRITAVTTLLLSTYLRKDLRREDEGDQSSDYEQFHGKFESRLLFDRFNFSTCNGFAPLVHFVTEKTEQNKFASLGVGH